MGLMKSMSKWKWVNLRTQIPNIRFMCPVNTVSIVLQDLKYNHSVRNCVKHSLLSKDIISFVNLSFFSGIGTKDLSGRSMQRNCK